MRLTSRLIIFSILIISIVLFFGCNPGGYILTVNVTPYNSGEVEVSVGGSLIEGDNGEYNIGEGKEVTLEAIPSDPYNTVTWSGAGLSGNDMTQTLTMDSDYTVTATFTEEATEYTLTVNIVDDGSVTVEVGGSEVNGTQVDADTTEYTISAGADATLTATPEGTNNSVVWSGDLTGTELTKTITMDSDKVVTATFSEVTTQHDLTLNTTGDGTVTVKADGSVVTPSGNVYTINGGAVVTLEAAFPGTNDKVEWSGDITNNGYIYQEFIMDGSKTISADFTTSTTIYDEFIVTRYIDGDIYTAMSQATPTDIIVFKNGLKFGNTLTLPANFNSLHLPAFYDIALSGDGTAVYFSGVYKDTSNDWHPGYWDTSTGNFTEPVAATGFAHMHSIVSPNDYVVRTDTFVYQAYVGGSQVTLSLPTGASLSSIGNMVSDGTNIYIAGAYDDGTNIHPIIWDSTGTIDVDVDYTTIGTDYTNFGGSSSISENGFAINTDGSYKFIINKMERTDGNYDTVLLERATDGTHSITILEGGFASSFDAPFGYNAVYYNDVFYAAGYQKNQTLNKRMPVYWTVETNGTITEYTYPTDDNSTFPTADNDRIYGIGFMGEAIHVGLENNGYFDGLNYNLDFKW